MTEARILLASQSPRRRALLEAHGLPFTLVTPGDEDALPPHRAGEDVEAFVVSRSVAKANGVEAGALRGLLLAVDTIVTAGGFVFGKPENREQARRVMHQLMGIEHEVMTAHAFSVLPASGPRSPDVAVERARVRLDRLDDSRLEAYLDSADWVDKAGGYGIQSVAASFAHLVAGDFDTVVGLHVPLVRSRLDEYRASIAGGPAST